MAGRPRTGRMKPCKGCDGQFWCHPSRDAGGSLAEKFYCSKACYTEHKRSPEWLRERFLSLVRKTDSCWIFEGCIGHEGYGSIATGDVESKTRKQYQSHRYSWMVHNGEIPDDKLVLHKCDVRACVNPEHLYLGDRKDNIRDAIERGRYHRKGMPLLWPELRYKHQRRAAKRKQPSAAHGEAKQESK